MKIEIINKLKEASYMAKSKETKQNVPPWAKGGKV